MPSESERETPSNQEMNPEDAKSAAIEQAELLRTGATIVEGGRVEVEKHQIERATAAMLAEKAFTTTTELVRSLGENPEAAIRELERIKANTQEDFYLRERLVQFLRGLKEDLEKRPRG